MKHELWVGNPAQIRAKRVRKHKNDREDARLLLELLVEDRFPRVWVASAENRDVRQLLWHRHRLGLAPGEDSSADRQRLGHISKQGNALLRFLLVEAAQAVVRFDPEWRRHFLYLAIRRHRNRQGAAMVCSRSPSD